MFAAAFIACIQGS